METIITIVISLIGGIVTFLVTFAVYKEKVRSLEEKVRGLDTRLNETRDMAVGCKAIIDASGPLTKRKSPVSLSDRGLRFLKDSGGEKFVDDNFNELLGAVEGHSPKTAYDVQESSRAVVEGLRGDERLNPLKDYLFKDGSTLDDLFVVMGIYLRDKILKDKNWNVEDIDRQEATRS